MSYLPREPFFPSVVILALICASCGQDQTAASSEPTTVDAAPPPRRGADASANQRPSIERPEYDDEGVPLPSKRQALGVAVPKGFKRVSQDRGAVHYAGRIAPEKVAAFYRRYLECLDVRLTPRGWRFSKATPRPPGDPSRSVDLTVIKVRDGSSLVVVIDRMARSKVKIHDGGPQTFDEFYREAHKGTGSIKQPIPGTY